ncbi:MAG: efflux RND transporter periplasmic adaptor subunit, partial [Candidatus Omnitrophota bacterium]
MKKTKTLLIGFILLWVLGFLVIWGITIYKKTPGKKADIPGINMGRKETGEAPGGIDSLESKSEAISVRCYRVSPLDFKDDLPVLGTIKGAVEVGLKFEISGIIESIDFREGDILYKGDLIAGLDKKDARLKVDYAKSKSESARVQSLAAEKKLEIFKDLYKIGGIIKAKLEEVELEAQSVELQAKSAEIELKSAEAELKKTELNAPRDGVLGSRDAEVGEFVTPQDKIATLYDTAEVFVELGLVEKDIDKVMLGQKVKVTVDAYPGRVFSGTVDNMFPIIEGKSRTLTVRVRLENPDAMLLPGMFARAMITVAEFKDAIVVPSLSLNRTDQGYTIFVVDENSGTVSSRIVEQAYVTTDYTVISSGLYDGELVVTDTPQELKNGMPVKIVEVQESVIEE